MQSLNIFQSELRSLTNVDIRKKGGWQMNFWRRLLRKMTCMLIGKQLQSHIQIMNTLSSNSKATRKLFQRVLTKQKDYFDRVFVAYKSDMKKTWQVISETLSRNKKSHEMPSVFNHEGHELSRNCKRFQHIFCKHRKKPIVSNWSNLCFQSIYIDIYISL